MATARTVWRVGPLAHDVADHQRPLPGARAEEVVEVTADLILVAEGAVARRDLNTRDLRQARRQQATLQGAGHVGALLVQTRAIQRLRALAAEGHHQVALLRREHARAVEAEPEAAQRLAAHVERDGCEGLVLDRAVQLRVALVPFVAALHQHERPALQSRRHRPGPAER
jgi:hypothetical protein